MSACDVIVVGLGGMGSAALDHLARRGLRVLGIEQYPLVHDRGSSHGHTRIIREAYHEHPDYVPLVRRAYSNWFALEQRLGRHLLTGSPCLTIGLPESEMVRGIHQSAQQHGLPVETLSTAEIMRRYPAFRIPEGHVGVVERNAGFLYVEACVRACLDSALASGATILAEDPVQAWSSTSTGAEVTTAKGRFTCKKLVLTAGAWATRLLADLGIPLTVMRQTLHWFRPQQPELFLRDKLPIYLADTPLGQFYGLPAIDFRGHKAARHYGAPELPGPEQVDWNLRTEDSAPIAEFLKYYLPTAFGSHSTGQVCMYTLSPDRHFIIDQHPAHPNVAFACGFSGHGFKFASVVGEILADLVEQGQTRQPCEFLKLSRFAKGY